ncbi:MAG TPA: sugar ABC transporter permease [Streptosporangiaceae bacterium]|jgi:multiple sugar transport system permease protein
MKRTTATTAVPGGAGSMPARRGRRSWPLPHLRWPRRAWLAAAILLVPAALLRLFTSVYPFVQTAWMSLTNESPLTSPTKLIGLENYRTLLGSSLTVQSIIFTVLFAVLSTIAELVFGIGLALLLNAPFRLRGFTRAVSLVPWAIPAIVTALGFKFMFSDGFGIIPDLLGHIGIHVQWLTSPDGAKAAVIIANVWRSVPFIALILLAGLQGIPAELLQAARVDGAGRVAVLRKILIPLITPLLVTMGVFMLIFQIGTFDTILGMTGGGPGTATQVLSYSAYQDAFIGLQYGKAAAEAMLLFVLVLAAGLAAIRLFRRSEVQL